MPLMPAPTKYVDWMNKNKGFNPQAQKASDFLSACILNDILSLSQCLKQDYDTLSIHAALNKAVGTKAYSRDIDLVIFDPRSPGPLNQALITVENKSIMTAQGPIEIDAKQPEKGLAEIEIVDPNLNFTQKQIEEDDQALFTASAISLAKAKLARKEAILSQREKSALDKFTDKVLSKAGSVLASTGGKRAMVGATTLSLLLSSCNFAPATVAPPPPTEPVAVEVTEAFIEPTEALVERTVTVPVETVAPQPTEVPTETATPEQSEPTPTPTEVLSAEAPFWDESQMAWKMSFTDVKGNEVVRVGIHESILDNPNYLIREFEEAEEGSSQRVVETFRRLLVCS